MSNVIHSIRKYLVGECPCCKSTNLKQVKGWNKLTCKDCGKTFSY